MSVLLTNNAYSRFSVTDDPNGPSIIIDAISFNLLKGSTLDFSTELIGSSFKVLNNPQSTGAGCGCGVSFDAAAI